jgi:hypothetical protein
MATSDGSGRAGRALTLGTLVGGTFRAWGAQVLPYTVVSVVFNAPLFFLAGLLFREDASPAREFGWSLVQFVVGGFATALVSATIAVGVIQRMRGHRPGIFACVGRAFSRIFPVIGVALLVGLIGVLVAAVLGGLTFLVIGAVRGEFSVEMRDAIGYGIVVGVGVAVILVRWTLTTPILVTQRAGAAALSESARLTAGNRLPLFVVLLVTTLTSLVVDSGLKTTLDELGRLQVNLVISAVLIQPLSDAALGFAFQTLKTAKDGIDVAATAKVFD